MKIDTKKLKKNTQTDDPFVVGPEALEDSLTEEDINDLYDFSEEPDTGDIDEEDLAGIPSPAAHEDPPATKKKPPAADAHTGRAGFADKLRRIREQNAREVQTVFDRIEQEVVENDVPEVVLDKGMKPFIKKALADAGLQTADQKDGCHITW